MTVQCTGHMIQTETSDNNTVLSIGWSSSDIKITLSIISIKNENLLNSNNNKRNYESYTKSYIYTMDI